jgi:hypothetical protein
MLEFCAACRIIDLYVSGQFDPVALQSGVACFMCSKLHNVTLLLEEHLSHCADVHEILPLLKEAHIAGGETGRFESLFDAITDSDELGINLSYSPPGEEETTFSKIIDNIVTTCKSFKPKALSVLKTAAESLIWSIQWDQTDPWFEMIVSALEFYNWPGAVFHRRLIKIRFFEYIEAFSDDGSDLEAPYRLRELEAYLDALDKDDFDHALLHLDKLAKILYDYIIKVEGDDAKTNIHHFPAQTLSLQMRLWPNDDSSLFENEV